MAEPGIVLLVEDNADILNNNRRVLEQAGHTVLCAATLAEAHAVLSGTRPDVIVLDIMLPDGSGLTLCRELREAHEIPVLLLTALGEKAEVIEGLRAGGNDYIIKPYDIDEFAARVEAQMRLSSRMRASKEESLISAGPLALNSISQRAYLEGVDLLLTRKEFAILLLLVKSSDTLVTSKALYEQVWQQPMNGDSRTLWTHISNLKRKLAASSMVSLVQVRGAGYRLEIVPRGVLRN